jgi:hypothetical protein
MKFEESKEKFENEIKRYVNKKDNDYFMRYLIEDHTKSLRNRNILNMRNVTDLEESDFEKITDSFFDSSKNVVDDIINLEWNRQIRGYWEDKLKLLELYTSPLKRIDPNMNPMNVYNQVNSLKIKIQRRLLIMKFKYSKSEQKHDLADGTKRNYKNLRFYWIHDDGLERRSISKHVSFEESDIDRVITPSLRDSGYTIYSKTRNNILIVGYGNSRYAVKLNYKENVNEDEFFHIFYFNELLSMFNKIYKQ